MTRGPAGRQARHAMHHLPTGTVTFLFTDIEGSTKRWERDRQTMGAALVRHNQILRSCIEEHQGSVVKTVGDAFFAVFPTAPDGLAAALAAQRALHAEDWGAGHEIRVRMALHTGTADEREGDYFGPSVNRAARILSSGHGGQILLSGITRELVRDVLSERVILTDLGEHHLKDLYRPEHLFQVVVSDLPQQFPALKTLNRQPTNLPIQPTSFVGRERELAEVAQLLSREDVRLLTLTGPGGTGKTRSAVQAAADLLDTYPDGVYFVPLTPLSDPALVVPTIASTLGVTEIGGESIMETVQRYLQDKHLLLVLDNFEHVMDACSQVGELLTACPSPTILVTSRASLNLQAEHLYPVPPLTLPDTGRLPDLATLSQYDAVALFLQRAAAARPSFVITNQNAPAIAEICVRLDGLPLAIELAAARIKLFPPQTLLSRLENRLKLLTGGARDLPVRQQTLRGAIDWSYSLLDEGEQMLFAWLSAFAGGCRIEAAEAVCHANGDLPIDVVDGLASLMEKSLIRQEETDQGEPRFLMLETIREYAGERLAQSGEDVAVQGRHATYFRELAAAAEPELTGTDQVLWLRRLDLEGDNLRAALAWFQEQGDTDFLLLAGSLWRYWYVRGQFTEGRRWLEAAVERWSDSSQDTDRSHLVTVLNGAGALAWSQGAYGRARELVEESLRLSQELGDTRGIAMALNHLGNLADDQGRYDDAQRLLEESLRLWRELGDTYGIAASLVGFGALAGSRQHHDLAVTLLVAAESLWESIGGAPDPDDRERMEQTLSAAREALSEQAEAAAREHGHSMSLEDAVEYALEEHVRA